MLVKHGLGRPPASAHSRAVTSCVPCPLHRAPLASVGLACPAPHVESGRKLSVVAKARRGRPPAQPEPDEPGPGPDLPDDELFLDDEFDEGEDTAYAEELDPMSRRLVEPDQPEPDWDDDGEYEEAEDEDEATETDRDGIAADGDAGEPSTSYPEPPDREFRASDLFGEAGLMDAALWLASRYPDVGVTGVQSNPHLVVPGDVFVLHPGLTEDDDLYAIGAAVEKGATVVVAPTLQPDDINVEPWSGADPLKEPGMLPDDLPVVRMEDTSAAGSMLAAAFYGAPAREMVTVGVLGEHGKTTTAWLIRGVLEELGQTVGLMSNIEHAIAEDRLDEDGYLWEATEEDPSVDRESSVPFKLIPYEGKYEQFYGQALPGLNAQKMLAGMHDRGAKVAVLEMGIPSLVIGTFDFVDINVAVVTSLPPTKPAPGEQQGRDAAKASSSEAAELIMGTLAVKFRDSDAQVLVLNLDDPQAAGFLKRLDGVVPVVTYSLTNSKADVTAESIKSNIWETEVLVKTPGGRLQFIINLLGRHNVSNLLAAVATGIALKAPLTSIVAGIEAVEIPGRSEVLDEGQDFSVVVDAARTPEHLAAMLEAIRQGGAKQIFTVFGCSGHEDPTLRPRMGAVAHAKSDYVIVTNESPRLEDPAKVVADIVAGFPDDMVNRYSMYAYFPFQDQGRTPLWFEPYLQKAQRDNKRYIMEDRYSAIRAAIGTAGPDDVVLLAGKGHEDWVEHAGEDGDVLTGWLDDRVEARNALSKLKYLKQIPAFNRDTLPWGSRIETLMETLSVDPGDFSRGLPTDE
ncbi:UDP-N-acetylmuramoyl-L-alanyl-D-glutamate--2,6-diaminopimelate ligase [Tetrabaena socialis]|uniref:UDP-N-acetylmuramoyl-L-alanyl-D-glutamate--2, 6-diaminopimelate ligase n=1 Tax=Tetrabaena socialis TaxID=47790 RepID=A0A2J7ZZB1_9CHLO|nr:UDP-N-acetylmuramoyl-L-alanyl-D-glutamate--2,6-diaminopimelate ligase [Tetrabaena socialis]|eukprot:PNH05610.1 UDP-N-acetylmuramoyl-L-alanyl-D-glutamate--2,6-diaminopimelate ligase [Tetrabaena socialis]